MCIDHLLAVCPPPRVAAFSRGDWAAVEAAHGVAFPEDFKAIVAHYGEGIFGGCVSLIPLFSDPGSFDSVDIRAALVDEIRKGLPEASLDGTDDSGGLFPWAWTRDAAKRAVLCWEMRGSPDTWNIAVHTIGEPDAESFRYSMRAATFLGLWMTRSLRCPVLPMSRAPDFDRFIEPSELAQRAARRRQGAERKGAIGGAIRRAILYAATVSFVGWLGYQTPPLAVGATVAGIVVGCLVAAWSWRWPVLRTSMLLCGAAGMADVVFDVGLLREEWHWVTWVLVLVSATVVAFREDPSAKTSVSEWSG